MQGANFVQVQRIPEADSALIVTCEKVDGKLKTLLLGNYTSNLKQATGLPFTQISLLEFGCFRDLALGFEDNPSLELQP